MIRDNAQLLEWALIKLDEYKDFSPNGVVEVAKVAAICLQTQAIGVWIEGLRRDYGSRFVEIVDLALQEAKED